MFFFLVAGNRYRTKREGETQETMQCPYCGHFGRFERRSGRQYLTLFLVLPVVPLGTRSEFVQCPKCRTRFESSFYPKAA